MFMSVVTHAPNVPVYAELAGKRVLITGLAPDAGVDLARGFADGKGRRFVYDVRFSGLFDGCEWGRRFFLRTGRGPITFWRQTSGR